MKWFRGCSETGKPMDDFDFWHDSRRHFAVCTGIMQSLIDIQQLPELRSANLFTVGYSTYAAYGTFEITRGHGRCFWSILAWVHQHQFWNQVMTSEDSCHQWRSAFSKHKIVDQSENEQSVKRNPDMVIWSDRCQCATHPHPVDQANKLAELVDIHARGAAMGMWAASF